MQIRAPTHLHHPNGHPLGHTSTRRRLRRATQELSRSGGDRRPAHGALHLGLGLPEVGMAGGQCSPCPCAGGSLHTLLRDAVTPLGTCGAEAVPGRERPDLGNLTLTYAPGAQATSWGGGGAVQPGQRPAAQGPSGERLSCEGFNGGPHRVTLCHSSIFSETAQADGSPTSRPEDPSEARPLCRSCVLPTVLGILGPGVSGGSAGAANHTSHA